MKIIKYKAKNGIITTACPFGHCVFEKNIVKVGSIGCHMCCYHKGVSNETDGGSGQVKCSAEETQ